MEQGNSGFHEDEMARGIFLWDGGGCKEKISRLQGMALLQISVCRIYYGYRYVLKRNEADNEKFAEGLARLLEVARKSDELA